VCWLLNLLPSTTLVLGPCEQELFSLPHLFDACAATTRPHRLPPAGWAVALADAGADNDDTTRGAGKRTRHKRASPLPPYRPRDSAFLRAASINSITRAAAQDTPPTPAAHRPQKVAAIAPARAPAP